MFREDVYKRQDLVREGGNDIFADELDDLAEMAGKSFVEVFRNEYGYLFDYVDGYMMDWMMEEMVANVQKNKRYSCLCALLNVGTAQCS